jgi:hypothetical protein
MSRRWRGPHVRRGRFLYVPPAQQTAQAPPQAPAFVEGQRPRALWLRRGRLFPTPPPLAAPVVPAAVPGFIRRVTVRLVQVRRRDYFDPPWLTPVAPVRPPSARRRSLPAQRGHYIWTPPTAAPTPPSTVPQMPRPRLRALFARRGEFVWTPPQTAAPAAPLWTPGTVSRSRLRPAGGRRGIFLPVPPAGTAPAAAPQPVRPRIRLAFLRRGRFTWTPQPAAAPTPQPPLPGYLSARRPRPPRGRRSDYFTPTPAPTGPAPFVQAPYRQPARRMIPTRRGVFARIAPAGVAPTAPVWVPAWLSRRATRVAAVRRGRIATPVLQQAQAAAWPVPLLQPRRRRLLPIRGGVFTTTAPAGDQAGGQAAPLFHVIALNARWSAGDGPGRWQAELIGPRWIASDRPGRWQSQLAGTRWRANN